MNRTGRAAMAALSAAALFFTAGCEDAARPDSPSAASTAEKSASGKPADAAGQYAAQGQVEVTLYFPNDQGNGLGVVKSAVAAKDKYTEAVKALVRGTDKPGLTNIFPADVKVRGVRVKDGIATADFSRALTQKFVGGSTGERMLVGALVNTLTEFPEVKKVLITVEGERIETISGHLDTSEPFARLTSLVP